MTHAHAHLAHPLSRFGVGFDQVAGLIDRIAREAPQGFPAYDIERTGEDAYRVTLALAGYEPSEVSVEVRENVLTVAGTKPDQAEGSSFLYRGIAGRSFKRTFQLADHVEVKSASLASGLLAIDLVREVPEAKKPRTVEINAG